VQGRRCEGQGARPEPDGSVQYHDIGEYYSLNLIFSVAITTRSHDASFSLY